MDELGGGNGGNSISPVRGGYAVIRSWYLLGKPRPYQLPDGHQAEDPTADGPRHCRPLLGKGMGLKVTSGSFCHREQKPRVDVLRLIFIKKNVYNLDCIPSMVLNTITDEETSPERVSEVPKFTQVDQVSKVDQISQPGQRRKLRAC